MHIREQLCATFSCCWDSLCHWSSRVYRPCCNGAACRSTGTLLEHITGSRRIEPAASRGTKPNARDSFLVMFFFQIGDRMVFQIALSVAMSCKARHAGACG